VWGGLFAWSTDHQVNPVGDWLVPANGATLLIEIQEEVAAEATTWSGVKAQYR